MMPPKPRAVVGAGVALALLGAAGLGFGLLVLIGTAGRLEDPAAPLLITFVIVQTVWAVAHVLIGTGLIRSNSRGLAPALTISIAGLAASVVWLVLFPYALGYVAGTAALVLPAGTAVASAALIALSLTALTYVCLIVVLAVSRGRRGSDVTP